MRILGTGDLHLGATHLTTYEEQAAALERLCEIADREAVDLVAIAGDATHHATPTPRSLALLGRLYSRLSGLGIRVVQVAGNHDPDVPLVAAHFRGTVTVATRPELVRIPGVADVGLLPWLPDAYLRAAAGGRASRDEIAQRLTEAARAILRGWAADRSPDVPLVLVAHATLAGTESESGWSPGFVPGTAWLLYPDDLAPFGAAIIGHIHKGWDVGDLPPGGPATIFVPGSLLPLDFSEREPKTVVIADVGPDGILAASREPIGGPSVATLDLDDATLAELHDDPALLSDWGYAADKLRVRIRCSERSARLYPPAAMRERLSDGGRRLVQVELDVQRPERPEISDESLSPVAALGSWIQGAGLAPELARDVADEGRRIAEARISDARAGGDLRVRRIHVRDFLGVREAELVLEDGEVVALVGPVGVGKSAIGADAVRFALSGSSRYGSRPGAFVVRAGASEARVELDLYEEGDGRRYRIVRTVRAGAGGSSSRLDVLRWAADPATTQDCWMPVSSGKVADGTEAIARILGELSDETLVASAIVVQRSADSFTRARPEERKTLLAAAAGLGIYDELASDSRDLAAALERRLASDRATETTLAEVVAGGPSPDEIGEAERSEIAAAEVVSAAELRERGAAIATRAAREAADAYLRDSSELSRIRGELGAISADRRSAERRIREAGALAPDARDLREARERAEVLARDVAAAERAYEAARARDREVAERRAELGPLRDELVRARSARERDLAAVSARADALEAQAAELGVVSDCPVIGEIRDGSRGACSPLRAASRASEELSALAPRLEALSEPSAREGELVAEIARLEEAIPAPGDPLAAERYRALERELARIRETLSEADVLAARAEEIRRAADAIIAGLAERELPLAADLAVYEARVAERAAARPSERVSEAEREEARAASAVVAARGVLQAAIARTATLRGRSEAAAAAEDRLSELRASLAATARETAAASVLVRAWRDLRVSVLETAVIPSVEQTANEILRRFPYGLSIALATSRATAAGERETLDVTVLGGRAPLYEGASGGQRTAIDVALHVAIALVVSRRATTRLRYLFADEPEGLDDAGRAAFATVARWAAEELGLTVVVASHAADLVDALGGRRYEVPS